MAEENTIHRYFFNFLNTLMSMKVSWFKSDLCLYPMTTYKLPFVTFSYVVMITAIMKFNIMICKK